MIDPEILQQSQQNTSHGNAPPNVLVIRASSAQTLRTARRIALNITAPYLIGGFAFGTAIAALNDRSIIGGGLVGLLFGSAAGFLLHRDELTSIHREVKKSLDQPNVDL